MVTFETTRAWRQCVTFLRAKLFTPVVCKQTSCKRFPSSTSTIRFQDSLPRVVPDLPEYREFLLLEHSWNVSNITPKRRTGHGMNPRLDPLANRGHCLLAIALISVQYMSFRIIPPDSD
jgi:hypothetical protein